MKFKIYTYKNCDTCRKAIQYLEKRKLSFENIPIREQPPSAGELTKMLGVYQNDIRKLFNTSGQDYKAMDMKSKLPKMSKKEAIELLSKNGNLVKRPFLLTDSKGVVGFKEEEWNVIFKK